MGPTIQVYCSAGVVPGAVPASVRLAAVPADHPFRPGHAVAEVGYRLAAAALWPLVASDWPVGL